MKTRRIETFKSKTNFLGIDMFLQIKEVGRVQDDIGQRGCEKIEYIKTKYYFLNFKYKTVISAKIC